VLHVNSTRQGGGVRDPLERDAPDEQADAQDYIRHYDSLLNQQHTRSQKVSSYAH
jgi:hypothetical protein